MELIDQMVSLLGVDTSFLEALGHCSQLVLKHICLHDAPKFEGSVTSCTKNNSMQNSTRETVLEILIESFKVKDKNSFQMFSIY